MHIPVLPRETIDLLDIQKDDVVLDGTVGSGGHATLIAERLGPRGVLIGLDRDREALERSAKKLQGLAPTQHLVCEDFRNLERVLKNLSIGQVQKILLDLGWSTDQFETGGRGFSFGSDEPLLMTLEKDPSEEALTARTIVNTWSEEELKDILNTLGEEQFSGRIARAIVESRRAAPILTTKDLVHIIEKAVPKFYLFRRIHPATKTFQALRIRVNDELGALREGLEKGRQALGERGRFAVITFHSLEDRIVKQTFREWVYAGYGGILTKKPITASDEEIHSNRRSRSAKLRVFQRASE